MSSCRGACSHASWCLARPFLIGKPGCVRSSDNGEVPIETVAVEAEAKPDSEPVVATVRPPSQEPLPAPPVPAAPVVKEDLVVVAPLRPVGVTAPPPPPLDVDIAEVRVGGGASTAPPGLEEVDTAITLEPIAPAPVAVAAGGGSDIAANDRAGDAPVAVAPAPITEVAALPADSGAVDGLDDFARQSLGVPVLKPAARLPQQSLGGRDPLATSGPSDANGSGLGGYAVQLSSLKTRAQAEREFERLRGDYPALLREVDLVVSEGSVSNRGTFFRVLTSRFEDAGAAQVLCRSLRDRGQDCLVVRR